MELDLFKSILPEYTMNVVLDMGQKVSVFTFKYAGVIGKSDMLMKLAKTINSKGIDWLKKVLALSCETYNGKMKVHDSVLGSNYDKYFNKKDVNYVVSGNEISLFFWKQDKNRRNDVMMGDVSGTFIFDKKIDFRTLEEVSVFSFDTFNRQN